MRTTVKTYRLTHAIADQLDREAERQRTTSADIVRTAIAQYFENQQQAAVTLSSEARILAHMDAQTKHISAGLAKILSLAEPVQG